MLIWDLLRTCLKRWYIIVIGLALVGAGSYFVYDKTPLTYEANGSVVLIPPRDSVLVGDNPYLYLGGLEQALGVLSVRMMSSEVMDTLQERHPKMEYTLGKDTTTAGPIMAITVVSSDEAMTLPALGSVIDLVPEQMGRLQEDLNVPKNSRITTQTLAMDEKPKVLTKDRTRMVAIVVAGGVTGVLLFTALFDRILHTFKDRRAQHGAAKESRGTRRKSKNALDKEPAERPAGSAPPPMEERAVEAEAAGTKERVLSMDRQ